jgi:hypothetical protein
MSTSRPKRERLRFTIVDERGTVSFVGDSFYLQPLLAGCAAGARTLDELLTAADVIDKRIREQVLNGLAVFDEFNTEENHSSIRAQLGLLEGEDGPVLRVLDEATLAESHRPTRTGFMIFNLKERRIVQGQSLFHDIVRGEAHVHNGRFYSRRTVPYELPKTWTVVP